jgi:integrase/recombinase XerC
MAKKEPYVFLGIYLLITSYNNNYMKLFGKKRQVNANSQLLEKYLEHVENSNKSLRTIANYRADLEKFSQWFAQASPQKSILKSVPKTISRYQSYLNGREVLVESGFLAKVFSGFKQRRIVRERPLSPNSQRRHICTIKNFFEFHVQMGGEDKKRPIKFNPVKTMIHKVKVKEVDIQHTKMLPLSVWEKLDLLATKPRDRLLLQLLYHTGLRISEAANLRFDQVDFDNQVITVERKGGKVHRLKPYWPTEIFDILARLPRHPERPVLFPGRGPGKLTVRSLYARIKRLLMAVNAEKDYSPHSFRKACASRLYRETKDLLLVRDYLNHSDAKVTQTYIDTSNI